MFQFQTLEKGGLFGTILRDSCKTVRLHTVLLRETLLKQKKNLQPVIFRWTVCAKHKHRCLPESLPESRHPRLTKIKFSYHHRQNTDKEPTAYSSKPNIIYLREYLLHNSSEFNQFVSIVNLIILFICEHLCKDIYLHICILT